MRQRIFFCIYVKVSSRQTEDDGANHSGIRSWFGKCDSDFRMKHVSYEPTSYFCLFLFFFSRPFDDPHRTLFNGKLQQNNHYVQIPRSSFVTECLSTGKKSRQRRTRHECVESFVIDALRSAPLSAWSGVEIYFKSSKVPSSI